MTAAALGASALLGEEALAVAINLVRVGVIAALAPVDLPAVLIVGSTLAVGYAYHAWSNQSNQAIQQKALAKHCAKGSGQGQPFCGSTSNTVKFKFTGNFPQTYTASGFSTPITFSGSYDYGYSASSALKGEHIGGAGNQINQISYEVTDTKVTPATPWKDIPDAWRNAIINENLTNDDWREAIQSLPATGTLQPGQILAAPAVLTSGTTSASSLLPTGAVVPAAAPTVDTVNTTPADNASPSSSSANNPSIAPTNVVAPVSSGAGILPTTGVTSTVFPSIPATATPSTGVNTGAWTPAATTPSTFSATDWVPSTGTTVGTTPIGTTWSPTLTPTGLSPTTLNPTNVGTTGSATVGTGVISSNPTLPDVVGNQQTIFTALAGLTLLAQGIQNNTAPAAIRSAAAAGTCDAAKPNGCLGSPLNNLQNSQNGLAQKIDQLEQAGQGALLADMSSRLSGMSKVLGTEVLPSGLVGGFKRLVSWAGIDRAIGLVGSLASIHNAFMLSTDIVHTLFSALDNILNAGNLLKNSEAEDINTEELFTSAIDKYFAGLFGATEWAALKAQYKAYNSIFSSVSQAFSGIREGIEEMGNINSVTKNWVAEMGNGLQDEGLLGEDNWNPKDDDDYKPKSKWGKRLEAVREGLEVIENVANDLEEVTGSVRSIVEQANEVKENVDEVKKAITEANKAAKSDRDAKVEGLELPNFSLDNLF